MVIFLGISASPRRGGNSETLLDQTMAGAAGAGAEVSKIRLAGMNIHGCTECNDCYECGECSTADDMDRVYALLERADRIVFASPIFFMGLPSQAKAMIDRCQRFWAMKYILKEPLPRRMGAPPRYGAFIGVGGTRGERLFDGAKLTIKYFYDAISVSPREELYLLVRGVDAKGEVESRQAVLDSAYKLGETLAKL